MNGNWPHLKDHYKNLFDSISVTRAQTKTIIDSLQNKLHDTIYENAKLRASYFDKVSDQSGHTKKGTSMHTKFAKSITERKPSLQPVRKNFVVRQPNAFQSNHTTSSKNRVPLKVDETNDLSKPVTSNSLPTPQESKNVIAPGMFRINPFKPSREEKYVPNKVRAALGNSNHRVDNTAKTRRPQPRSNTKNDRVPSASKSSCIKNKEVEVEEHHRNLLLSKNKKHMSSECKHVKLDTRNDQSEVICAMCKQCLITANHDFLGTVRFGNDHVAAILGFGDLKWGNILITRVYFVEGLGHNLFSVGQFCDSDLEVAFRRNSCFVRNLDGVDLLKGNRSTNLYTINLHEMASASPICLMVGASFYKSSGVWHQRLSHLNFDTINDLAKNDLVSGLPKFKYHKEHLCPSCEQGKSKRASHPPKPVPNSKRRLHLLHMDLCGPMRIASINGKRYVLVIVDDYSRYTWVHFLRSKDEAPEVIKTFLKRITVNDREDIGKIGAKGDIGFFIGYSADSCAYRVYNRRTKKIMETMNVTFNELSAMAFEQSSSKPGLQSTTSGQISSGLDLTLCYVNYITTQKTNEGDLDLLFLDKGAMYDDFMHQPTIIAGNVPNAMFDEDTFVNPFATPSTSTTESSSSQYVDPSNMHTFYQPYPHKYQWTKDHPLEQVIGEPS
ncbi:retrovirus-related pol polyprotein from transposon TNT 1-94 [Tanacetum coccineum]